MDRDEKLILSEKFVRSIMEKRMTKRDLMILELLRKHKFASRDQLVHLLDMDHLKQAAAILNKRLRFLYSHHFVDRTYAYERPISATPTYIYSLDRAYRYVVGKNSWKRYIKHMKTVDGQIVKRLPITYMHNLMLNDVVIVTKKVSRDANWNLRYVGIEEENLMAITYRRRSGIVPDLIVILMDPNTDTLVSLFVEVDMGNEGKDLLKSKIGHYHALKTYRTWVNADWYRAYVAPHVSSHVVFPHIVFLLGNHTSSRTKMIRDALHRYGLTSSVLSLTDYDVWIRNHMIH